MGARDPSPCQTSLSFVIPDVVFPPRSRAPSLGREHRSRRAGGEERKMQILIDLEEKEVVLGGAGFLSFTNSTGKKYNW